MIKQLINKLYFTVIFMAVFLFIPKTQANGLDLIKNGLTQTAQEAFVNTAQNDAVPLVAKLILFIIGALGVIFLVVIIYAGFQWMTAMGSEEKIDKANTMIKESAVGIMIVLFAWLLTNFVINRLLEVTKPVSQQTSQTQPTNQPKGLCSTYPQGRPQCMSEASCDYNVTHELAPDGKTPMWSKHLDYSCSEQGKICCVGPE